MSVSVFVLVPTLVLTILSIIILLTAKTIVSMYKSVGEPIFVHVAVIFMLLFITFFSGAIGVFLSLDQMKHPLFLFNVLAFSLTYVVFGFIYRSLSHGVSPVQEYVVLLLALAPAYALGLMLGMEFNTGIAIASQTIALIIVWFMDISILNRINEASTSIKGKVEKDVLKMFKDIISWSKNIHSIGLLAMAAFSLLVITNTEYQAQEIWGPTWQLFDYLYFVALVVLVILFALIYSRLKKIESKIISADIPLIVNTLLA